MQQQRHVFAAAYRGGHRAFVSQQVARGVYQRPILCIYRLFPGQDSVFGQQ